jgi:predicted esterase
MAAMNGSTTAQSAKWEQTYYKLEIEEEENDEGFTPALQDDLDNNTEGSLLRQGEEGTEETKLQATRREEVHMEMQQSDTYQLVLMSKWQARCNDPRVIHMTYELSATGEMLPFALFVPSSYSAEKSAPLLVLLHGFAQTYDAMLSNKVDGLLDDAEQLGMLVVTPLGYHRAGWYGSRTSQVFVQANLKLQGELSELDVMEVLALVEASHNIDLERIYLGGHSMGGIGALHLAMRYPKLWAAVGLFAPAVVPQPGCTRSMDDLTLIECPMFITVGTEDKFPLLGPIRAWVDRMSALGMPHEYAEVEGGDHSDILITQRQRMLRFITSHRNPNWKGNGEGIYSRLLGVVAADRAHPIPAQFRDRAATLVETGIGTNAPGFGRTMPAADPPAVEAPAPVHGESKALEETQPFEDAPSGFSSSMAMAIPPVRLKIGNTVELLPSITSCGVGESWIGKIGKVKYIEPVDPGLVDPAAPQEIQVVVKGEVVHCDGGNVRRVAFPWLPPFLRNILLRGRRPTKNSDALKVDFGGKAEAQEHLQKISEALLVSQLKPFQQYSIDFESTTDKWWERIEEVERKQKEKAAVRKRAEQVEAKVRKGRLHAFR